ncbi:hypothetical protein H9Q69_009051 [Fusarium xylarioides]|nr:hypothetical protein H9Q69_009051 [Fusarium xylarioides]
MAKKLYAISQGRSLGYRTNYDDVKTAINGYKDPEFRGFDSIAEARKWMNDPRRTTRRLQRQAQDRESPNLRRQLEKEVAALNEEFGFETAEDVTINQSERDAICTGSSALTLGTALIVGRLESGLKVRPLPPSLFSPPSPSSSSPSSPSSSTGDTLPSSPPSAGPVKRTSSTPSD